MKGRRGNPGLVGKLLDKSIEAYILALETINRLSIKYRAETFTYLVCNAWELLLKAKLRSNAPSVSVIYYKKARNELRRSISLRDAAKRVFPNEKDAVRRNIEAVADLRDASTHLIISDVPRDILCLFQASVINYSSKLKEWFDQSLADRVTLGMMTIVYNIDPQQFDLSSAQMKSSLTRMTYDYLVSYQQRLDAESKELGYAAEFKIGINYKLVLTKNPNEADISLDVGASGVSTSIIEVPKDSCVTHPFLYSRVYEEVNQRIGSDVMGVHDMKCIVKLYDVHNRREYYYRGKFKSSPGQFSEAFVNWLVTKHTKDQEFFARCRNKYRETLS
jgi:hypothetical protein